jgi:hypothetical protein
VSLEELEAETKQASLQRTHAEKIVEDYHAGLGSEAQQTTLLLKELQEYLSNSQETHAFKDLLRLVDALKLCSETQVKVEQLLKQQLTIEDLADLMVVFNEVRTSQLQISHDLAKLLLVKQADLEVTKEICGLIKKELEK